MGKKRKNRNQDDKTLKQIILITATIQLITAIINLIAKLLG